MPISSLDAKGISFGADHRGMNAQLSHNSGHDFVRLSNGGTLAILFAIAVGGCSAGVKIGSDKSDQVPESKPTLSSGLFSFDASVPWIKAGASIHPSLPSFNWFNPSVEAVNPSTTDKPKAATAGARHSARGPVLAAQPVDPCTLTQNPDQPAQPDIEAIGYASVNAQHAEDVSQRRLLAARASRLDAYRNLVEQIYGVQFSSDSSMLDARLGEDSFRTRMDGSMCGATVVSIEPLGDDLYQTRLRLPGVVAAGLRAHGKTTTL